jgi:4-hydroxy-tetrahydrodipicolinate synthase
VSNAVIPGGSLTPLVTPFRDGAIDDGTFQALVEEQVEAGSHGITVAGTTGEPASLTLSERERLIALAVEAADGRLPVLAGTGTNELESTLRLTRFAERTGASAVLVVTPYYVRPNQAGLSAWFERVADETELPLILYDIPGRSAVELSVDTIERLSERANIVGAKFARPDLEHVSRVIARCGRDFAVYCGFEPLCFPMLCLGGAGHISATANVFPREVAALADAAFAGEWDRAREMHFALREVNEAIFFDTNPVPVKTMLAAQGKASAEVRPPLAALDAAVERRVRDVLERVRFPEHDLA